MFRFLISPTSDVKLIGLEVKKTKVKTEVKLYLNPNIADKDLLKRYVTNTFKKSRLSHYHDKNIIFSAIEPIPKLVDDPTLSPTELLQVILDHLQEPMYSSLLNGEKLMTLQLRDNILQEFKKSYKQSWVIHPNKISSNELNYSNELGAMPTMFQHANCIADNKMTACNIRSAESQLDPMLLTGSVVAPLAIGGLLFYSIYRIFKTKSHKESYTEKFSKKLPV